MTDTKESLDSAAVAAWLLFMLAAPCRRAAAPPAAGAPPSRSFFTRYDFHLTGVALSIDDPRFTWDARFGGEVDLIDYVAGRTSIAVDYEAVLGDQFRAFDPNQGNYILEASSSARAGQTEIVGVFHHVSRHLSDRPKLFAIAWNTFGARVLRSWSVGGTTVDGDRRSGQGHRSTPSSTTLGRARRTCVRHALAPEADVFMHGTGRGDRPRRADVDRGAGPNAQAGGLVEAGVRLKGRAARSSSSPDTRSGSTRIRSTSSPSIGASPASGSSTAEGVG